MRASWILMVLIAAGCTRPTGDSLIVVSVDAATPLSDVAVLHATMSAGGQTMVRDVGAGPFTIPPAKTFAVDLPASVSGDFWIHVEARDTGGAALASGDAMIAIALGQTTNLSVTLGAPSVDMLPPTDMPSPVDLASPPVVSQSIWIGSGGSASTAAHELNLRIGGTNTTGVATAPSGATFTPGFFAQQTN